jgi:hypothetical protein
MNTRFTALAVLTAISILTCTVYADSPMPFRSGSMYLKLGTRQSDFDELNARLEANGFGVYNNKYRYVGIGLNMFFGRVTVGLEGGFSPVGKNATFVYERLWTSYACLDLGFSVHSSSRLEVYPVLGFGWATQSLRLYRTDRNFDDVLDGWWTNAEIYQSTLYLAPAVGLDYLITFSEDAYKLIGVNLGLRAGYSLNVSTSEWQNNEADLADSPETAITGPFLELTIGLGAKEVK